MSLAKLDTVTIEVNNNEKQKRFEVVIHVVNPSTGRKCDKKFKYFYGRATQRKMDKLNENVVKNILFENVLKGKSIESICDTNPSTLKSMLTKFITNLNRSKQADYKFDQLKTRQLGNRGGRGEATMTSFTEKEESSPSKNDPPIEQVLPDSIFAPEEESANTKVFLAPSFTGKTTFMVAELNRLTEEQLNGYDMIVLFTESTAAAPLKKLKEEVKKKIMVFDRLVPKFLRILKRINTETDNRYRFLVLFDDCLNLRQDITIKLILTLRNSNISTVISTQYSKVLAPSQRQSIHDYYFCNLKVDEWEFFLSGFIGEHIRNLLVSEGDQEAAVVNYRKLAEKIKRRMNSKKILLNFDQRHDQIRIFKRHEEKEKQGESSQK